MRVVGFGNYVRRAFYTSQLPLRNSTGKIVSKGAGGGRKLGDSVTGNSKTDVNYTWYQLGGALCTLGVAQQI